MTQRRIVVVWF